MTINLITFASAINKNVTVRTAHEAILNQLSSHFKVNLVDYKDIKKLTDKDFSLLFIATGGVERLVMHNFEALPKPVVMLADGTQNSLAAALEISSWFRSRGMKSEILHGEPDYIIGRIKILYTNFKAGWALVGNRIGVIGTPSSWLIASNVDYLLAKRRWGVEYIDIPLERVYKLFDKITDDEVGQSCAEFAGNALACREGSPEDILKAMRLYRAIKQVCVEENLQALTLSCFSLIQRTGSTGCLALSLLNDEGIPAGCEGDLQSVFTLLSMQALTGNSGFMANPSKIDITTNQVVFAHCTIGIKQTERYIIRNHFETDMGIAIQGILPTGEVTLIKCGGESLDEYFLSSGTLVHNMDNANMCRTQILVKMDTQPNYFLKNPLGNHHIILQGNHVEAVHDFFQANACKRIE